MFTFSTTLLALFLALSSIHAATQRRMPLCSPEIHTNFRELLFQSPDTTNCKLFHVFDHLDITDLSMLENRHPVSSKRRFKQTYVSHASSPDLMAFRDKAVSSSSMKSKSLREQFKQDAYLMIEPLVYLSLREQCKPGCIEWKRTIQSQFPTNCRLHYTDENLNRNLRKLRAILAYQTRICYGYKKFNMCSTKQVEDIRQEFIKHPLYTKCILNAFEYKQHCDLTCMNFFQEMKKQLPDCEANKLTIEPFLNPIQLIERYESSCLHLRRYERMQLTHLTQQLPNKCSLQDANDFMQYSQALPIGWQQCLYSSPLEHICSSLCTQYQEQLLAFGWGNRKDVKYCYLSFLNRALFNPRGYILELQQKCRMFDLTTAKKLKQPLAEVDDKAYMIYDMEKLV